MKIDITWWVSMTASCCDDFISSGQHLPFTAVWHWNRRQHRRSMIKWKFHFEFSSFVASVKSFTGSQKARTARIIGQFILIFSIFRTHYCMLWKLEQCCSLAQNLCNSMEKSSLIFFWFPASIVVWFRKFCLRLVSFMSERIVDDERGMVREKLWRREKKTFILGRQTFNWNSKLIMGI